MFFRNFRNNSKLYFNLGSVAKEFSNYNLILLTKAKCNYNRFVFCMMYVHHICNMFFKIYILYKRSAAAL